VRASSIWHNSDFVRLWSAYSISRLGSQITLLALPLTAVFVLGAGPVETGLLVAARMASSLFPGLFLGAWVDRRRRMPVIVASNIGSAVVMASIPVAAAFGMLTMPQLYVCGYLAGVFGYATDLARQAVMPALVGRDALVVANSSMQVSGAVTQIAGPSLGGVLVQALTAPVAIAFDAATFVISAAMLASIRLREVVEPRAEGRHMWHDITEGLAFVRGQPLLLASIVAIALANVEWFAVLAVLVVYATDELQLSPVALGLAFAAVGPATLLGAALATPLITRFGLGPMMIIALLFEAVSRLILPFITGDEVRATILLGLTQALVGVTEALWFVGSRTLQQAVTPDRLLGRVGAASFFIQGGVGPPAALVAGVVAAAIGIRPTLLAAGLIAVVALVYIVASPIRTLRAAPAVASDPDVVSAERA
jgi:MFS family permease